MADIPPWLEVMRAITGLTEWEDGSNPKVEGMAAYIGRQFPPQADYASQFSDDSIAWCGVATDFCLAACTPPISGPFGPTDTDKWMWADSFRTDPNFVDLGAPVHGCIVVMKREGGNHVTMLEEDLGSTIKCRGGNQSDMVNVATYDKDLVTGWMWPKAYPMPEVPRQTLEEGDSGVQVTQLQYMLGLAPADVDGDFGPTTDAAVLGFQRAWGLEDDGIVGEQTWGALDTLQAKLGNERLSPGLVEQISAAAEHSAIAKFPWDERGTMPAGYNKGMALSWAVACQDLAAGKDWAGVMAAAASGDDKDVLSLYESHLKKLGWDCSQASIDTMRHLWCITWALGPRESSGNHFCGRDQSVPPGYYGPADTTTEAGAWQWSWDVSSSSDTIPALRDEYWANPSGFLTQWNEGMNTDAGNIECFGDDDGVQAQWLSKYCAVFSAMVASVALRKRCNHFGPINRDELDWDGVEIADELLRQVQGMVEGGVVPEPPEPEPPEPELGTPRVDIVAPGPVQVTVVGDVNVTVNGEPYGS